MIHASGTTPDHYRHTHTHTRTHTQFTFHTVWLLSLTDHPRSVVLGQCEQLLSASGSACTRSQRSFAPAELV